MEEGIHKGGNAKVHKSHCMDLETDGRLKDFSLKRMR